MPDTSLGIADDISGLTASADFLYVMDYDVRSQVIDRCLAVGDFPSVFLHSLYSAPYLLHCCSNLLLQGALR